MNKYLVGTMAGFAATVPMTFTMFLLRSQLPWQEKHPLPPEDITEELASRLGARRQLEYTNPQVATWSAHFAFGAGAGALYGPLAEKVQAPAALKGAIFGLFVWAVSYFGWLPQMAILDQPKQQ